MKKIKASGGQVLIIHPGWVQTYMKGELDKEADLSPDEAAAHTLRTVQLQQNVQSDKPHFLDYLGSQMPW